MVGQKHFKRGGKHKLGDKNLPNII